MTKCGIGIGLFALCGLIAACGGDECKVGTSRCVTESLIRTCVPGNEQAVWIVNQCPPSEMCDPDALPGGGAGDSDGGARGGGGPAACVGSCEQGESECVSPDLARYCVNGRAWQLDPCSVGEACDETTGTCRLAPEGEGVRACEPNDRACVSDEVEKVCDADGTAWVARSCEDGETCLVDRCAPDPDASCDEGSRCMDNKTALRCLGEASGFELVECEGDTYCELGRCRGSVCALGSVCAGLNQIRECVDGESFRDKQCGVNEVCKQEGDAASCVPENCVPGVTVCGDPRDATVDATRFYSQCMSGGVTSSGVPEWATGECTGLLTCDPTFAGTFNPCRQACTPGAQTCMIDPQGIADGFAECQDDGTWGPIERCNPAAESRLQCVLQRTPDASSLPVALCAEPVCAFVITNQNGVGGTCEGAQLQSCLENGTLSAAEDCEVGICRPTVIALQADGRLPGACDTELECEDGEQRCIRSGVTLTPLYQVCDGSTWSPALRTCAGDETCRDYVDQDGLSQSLCGAECTPGHRRCNNDDELETCDANGSWGVAESCGAGICQAVGSNDAACVLQCVPDSVRCVGVASIAPDGSLGYRSRATCNSAGAIGTSAACASGQLCRISGRGEHIGCVECVGPEVLGGNAQGYMDTRCDPDAPEQVQSCGADNAWEASRACEGGTSCVGPSSATCGLCLSAAGNAVVCTQTNIDDQEVCGSCTVNASFLSECTQTAIDTLTTGAESCTTQFTGASVAWGGVADCCDGSAGAFLQTTNESCATMGYGTATPWGGEVDCCSFYQFAAGGPNFAYCAP